LLLPPSSLTARVSSRLHRRSLTARVTSSPPSLPPPPELPAPSLPRRLSHHLHRRPFTATVLPPPSPPELPAVASSPSYIHHPYRTVATALHLLSPSSLLHFTSCLHRRDLLSPLSLRPASSVATSCLHVSTLRLTSTICSPPHVPQPVAAIHPQSTINALNQRSTHSINDIPVLCTDDHATATARTAQDCRTTTWEPWLSASVLPSASSISLHCCDLAALPLARLALPPFTRSSTTTSPTRDHRLRPTTRPLFSPLAHSSLLAHLSSDQTGSLSIEDGGGLFRALSLGVRGLNLSRTIYSTVALCRCSGFLWSLLSVPSLCADVSPA
jgi:hypothetical protein